MPVEGNRNAVNRHRRIAFNDDTRRMPGDRANACIAHSRHRDSVDQCCSGRRYDTAAMTGCVAESNHVFHGLGSRFGICALPIRGVASLTGCHVVSTARVSGGGNI